MLYDLHLEKYFDFFDMGEKIYKDFYETGTISADKELIEHEHMYIPGVTTAGVYISEDRFQDNINIDVTKHACYMPLFEHSHAFFEIIYVLSGSCENYIDDNCIKLSTGDFCIITPGCVHALGVFNNSLVINIIIRKSTFSETFSQILCEKNILSDFFCNALSSKSVNPYTVFHSGEDIMIHNLLEMLIYECVYGEKTCTEKIRENLMSAIFRIMIQNHENNFDFPSALTESSDISEIFNCIYKSNGQITLQELSDRFHYTVPYLSRRIKQESGQRFSDIIQSLRIQHACNLLKNTALSMQIIAEECGFAKVSSFYKQFRKFVGISPKKYRDNK